MTFPRVCVLAAWLMLLPLVLTLGCGSLPKSSPRKCPSNAEVTNTAQSVKTGAELRKDRRERRELARAIERTNKPLHVIKLDAEGYLLNLRAAEKPIPSATGVADYLATNIVKGFHDQQRTHPRLTNLLVFVHGGMNDDDTGMQHFWSDYDNILNDGYYPVFVVWPSGFFSTYCEHLTSMRQGIKAESLGGRMFTWFTVPFVLVADLGRAVTRLPLVLANTTYSDWGTTRAVRNVDDGAAANAYQKMVTHGFHVRIEDDYRRTSDGILRVCSYILTWPVKCLGASLIDGFGKGAWDDMLRRTQYVYPAAYDASLVEQIETSRPAPTAPRAEQKQWKRDYGSESRYAAAGLPAFVYQLSQMTNVEITLVGHSMGTIILNRVLRADQIEARNIVYMGGACSVEDFTVSVPPYLREHTNTQFYSLSLHPMAEAGEGNLADLAPRGSLLVWIDNFLANPVSERERTFGSWQNLFRASATGEPVIGRFYANDPDGSLTSRMHFRAFSVGFGDTNQMCAEGYQWNRERVPESLSERRDQPLKHGEFSDMPYWCMEFWWPDGANKVGVQSQPAN